MTAYPVQYGLNADFFQSHSSGALPWATVDLSSDGQGGVLLTLSVAPGNDIGRLSELYVNYNPSLDAKTLRFSAVDTMAIVDWESHAKKKKLFKAKVEGNNIKFTFTGDNYLISGETITFRITSTMTELTPDHFAYLGEGGTRGTYHAAARIRYAGGGLEGWIHDGSLEPVAASLEVPDGIITVTVLALAILSLELIRRRNAKAAGLN